jgi:outer membrane receptor protein involved in Fe transport
LERREIAKVPGTGGDALRSIQSLPGVARPPGLAGLLIVRGSAPQDTNTFIDGALVPLIYHFGGLSSVVPTELLDRIDFYPGNFSAEYGRVSGGVVDVALRSPETGCFEAGVKSATKKDCFHGLAQVDLITGRALVQGPIAKNWSFAIAGRRSWVDAWLKPVLEQTGAGVSSAPVYYDYQAIVEYKEASKRKLRMQFYGSDDSVELLIKNPAAQEPVFSGSLSFGTAFYRAQITYEEQLSRAWNLRSSLSMGRDQIRFGFGPLRFELDSFPISLRTELGWKPISGLKLNAGMDTLLGNYNVHVRAPAPGRPGEPPPGPFSARPIFDTRTKGTSYRPAWYLEAEVQPIQKLLIVPGVRVDFARDSTHADFSPRISARYTLRGGTLDEQGNKVRKTAIKGGFGYFYQPPQFQESDPVFGKPGLYSNRSLHIGLGVEQELSDQVEVSVEGYWKPLTRLVSRSPFGGSFAYNNEGRGRVLGLETLIKYKPDDRFFGWLAYTLSKSVRQAGPGQEEYLFQYDQTHILTLLGSYRLGDGWELGARFRLVSGNTYTPIASGLPSVLNVDVGSYTPLEGKPFSRRLPLFHQLDVRLEKTWQFDAWRLQAYLDVWNAYNHAAVEDELANFNYTLTAPQSGLPLIPSLGLRGEF